MLLLSIRNEPGKRHPHAAVGRPLLVQGRCTCPSCHRWLSQSQSFPERREESRCGETLTWRTNTVHTVRQRRSHLSVYVAISVNVVKVKRPLQLFSQCSSQQYRQTHYKVLAAMGQKTKSDFKKIIAPGHKWMYGAPEWTCREKDICISRPHVTTLSTHDAIARCNSLPTW